VTNDSIEGLTAEFARLAAENERLRGETSSELSPLDLEALVGALPCLVFLLDVEDRYIDYRQGAGAQPFVGPEAFIGRHMREVMPADPGNRLAEAIAHARVNRTVELVEYSLPTSGGQLSYEGRIVPLDRGRVCVLVFEVTERVRSSEALKIRLEQQSAVARLGLSAIHDPDISSLMTSAVRSVAATLDVEFCKILELLDGEEDLLLRAGTGWRGGLVGRARVPQGTDSQAGYTLLSNRPVFVFDLASDPRFRGPPLLVEHGVASGISVVIRGHDRPFGVLGAHTTQRRTFTREDGNFLQAVANVISQAVDRKRAWSQLRAREQRFRAMIERSSDIVLVVDADGVIRFASPAVEPVLGYTANELRGRSGFDLVDPPALAAMREEMRATVAQPGTARRVDTVPVRHRDGTLRILDAHACSLLHVPAVSGIVVNLRDVTTHRQLELQLDHARRLESVGRLAGGIAHDFNNILTAILGNAELLTDGSGTAADREEVTAIKESVERGQDLVRQLLAFARRQVLKPRVIDLNQVLRETDLLLRRLVPENVVIEAHFEEPLWPVLADPTQIQQVIVNLTLNARDAMPDGGTLTIETANVELDSTWARAHAGAIAPGPHVMLALSDTGTGMSADVLEHAFEPFFSTKPVGQGAGLGLATVFGIVRQSGGHIFAWSEPGLGSTFKIYLPREAGPVGQAPVPAPSVPANGTETLLLVEDDAAVLRAAQRILESAGYRVLAANGPAAALAIEAGSEEIDLLVTDVVMPGMNGNKLAERLRLHRPDLAVLFISGYTEDAITHHGVVDEGTHFLPKPFGRIELLAMVREVLDSRKPSR
jgi:PAS domain S-box-containing protein